MINAIPSAVYVMARQDGLRLMKIGRSLSPEKRLKDISAFTPVTLAYATDVRADASLVEALVHRTLADQRVHSEWFAVTKDEAIGAVHAAVAESDARSYEAKERAWKRYTTVRPGSPWVRLSLDRDLFEALEIMRDDRADGSDVAQIIREGLAAWLKSIGKVN